MRNLTTTDLRAWLVWLCALAVFPLNTEHAIAAQAGQRPQDKAGALTLQLFAGNLKDARARAAERNVPIVAIALLEDEADNVSARDELLASEELAALSVQCVLFFSNNGQHKPREIVEVVEQKKRTRSVCSAFGTANCREHQQHWDEIYNKFNQDGELRCPQVLVLTPEAKLEDRVSPGMKPAVSAIAELVLRTQAKLGRGLDEAALASIKEANGRAARAESAGKWGSAWRAFAEVLAIAPDGSRAVAAKLGQARAEAAFAKQRDEASAKLGLGNGLDGYLALEELARDWNGTEQAALLSRILKRAEKEPALKEALAKKRREDEAQALWNEAEQATIAKQPKEAERKLRMLLRKYADTAAYARAAKAHPEWVPKKPTEK